MPRIDGSFELILPASLSGWIPIFHAHGFYIDLDVSYGLPKEALDALLGTYGSKLDFSRLGLIVEPLKQESDIPAVIEILRNEFAMNDAYLWFRQDPHYISMRAQEFARSINDPNSYSFILKDDSKRIIGYFGMGVKPKDLLWCSSAGTEFFFDPSARGKGLVKAAYRHLLEIMIQKNIRAFFGGTNQPAILRLNQVMKRKTFAYVLRFGAIKGLALPL